MTKAIKVPTPVILGSICTDCWSTLPQDLALSINDAALLTGIGRAVIYLEVRSGRLKSSVVSGRPAIKRDDLLEWFLAHGDAE